MPIYEYKCTKCNKEFELIVSKPDPRVSQNCPTCGKKCKTVTALGKSGISFRFNYFEE